MPRSTKVERWYDRGWLSFRLVVKVVLVVALAAALMPATAGAVAVWTVLNIDTRYLPADLPEEANPTIESRPSLIYDRNGQQIAEFREFDLSVPIDRGDIPDVMKDAIVAAEDRRFYDHRGVDVLGVFRALWENYEADEVVQGGSTLTQQYVKNAFLSSAQTFERKGNEALIAMQLEDRLQDELGEDAFKDEIIFLYLDTAYYGDGLYGVGAAASSWFGKPVSELRLDEAALIAGVVRSPTDTAPRTDPEAAAVERDRVLRDMRELGFITQDEFEESTGLPVRLVANGFTLEPATWVRPPPRNGANQYPYFVDYVRRYIEEKYGADVLYRGGLRVTTTLDPGFQQMAIDTVRDAMDGRTYEAYDENGELLPPPTMSLASVDPRNGHVRALVGGFDFDQSQVNLGLGGSTGFQPGSSFKPYALAAAFERGAKPETRYPAPGAWRLPGCQGQFDQCHVTGGSSAGGHSLRSATVASSNVVFAQVSYDLHPDTVVEMGRRLGVSYGGYDEPELEELEYGVTVVLGDEEVSPLDQAAGFATFASSGRRHEATPVVLITDEDGTVIEDNTAPGGERVLDPAIADTVTDVMRGVISGGTGRRAGIGRPAAGKTGTTTSNNAAWFVGYTPQLSTAIWIGHPDRSDPVRLRGFGRAQGGGLPAQTWSRFMRQALENEEVLDFPEPGPLPPPVVADFSEAVILGDDGAVRGTGLRGGRAILGIGTGCDGTCVESPPSAQFSTTSALRGRDFATTTVPPEPSDEESDDGSSDTTVSGPTTTDPPSTTSTPPTATTVP